MTLDQGHVAKAGGNHPEFQVVESVWMASMVPVTIGLIHEADRTAWKRTHEMVAKSTPIFFLESFVHVLLSAGGQVTTKGCTWTLW